MLIDTRSGFLAVTNTSNVTDASITFPVPTTTMPTGTGVITMGSPDGSLTSNGLILIPFGAGSATQAFTMTVYAWYATRGVSSNTIWVATTLASFTCTLSTVPGLAGTEVDASQLFCGTITLATGNANVSNEIISPTGNTVGHILLDAKGARRVEVRFAKGTATSANCLVQRM